MSRRRPIAVIGIGADGCASLSSRAVSMVGASHVLVGGARHLEFFPQFHGRKIALRAKLGETLDEIEALVGEHTVCFLASGDPLFFGVGALVVRRFGADNVDVLPHPSSVQWAFARAGLKWDDATIVSLHGRPRDGLATRLKSAAKVAVLTDDENTPQRIATHLLEHGETALTAWVCEDLGGADERVRPFASLTELAAERDVRPLNVLLLVRGPEWRRPARVPFLHEDAFAKRMPKKGLITKREVRVLSLAALSIRPDAVVWDVGAGSGSVAIEAAMLAPEGRVYAIEVDPEGVALCRENARAHGVDNVRVIAGRAPEALADLETPDAVFVGGSKGSMDAILDLVFARLAPGGRVVVNAITLENVAETYRVLRAHGAAPELTLVNVSRGEPLASYLRYEALNPVHIFAASKPAEAAS